MHLPLLRLVDPAAVPNQATPRAPPLAPRRASGRLSCELYLPELGASAGRRFRKSAIDFHMPAAGSRRASEMLHELKPLSVAANLPPGADAISPVSSVLRIPAE